jgi:hypothetical protein
VAQQIQGVWWDVAGRKQHVTPIPTVERRMRNEGAETTGERECGHQQRNGEDRADECRTNGNLGTAPARFEGEAHADERRNGEAQ